MEGDAMGRPGLALPGEQRLFPREMVWLYPLAPLAAAPLLADGLLSMPWKDALRQLASIYIPFASMSFTFHLLYQALRGADGIHEVELKDGQVARVSRRLLTEVKRGLGLE